MCKSFNLSDHVLALALAALLTGLALPALAEEAAPAEGEAAAAAEMTDEEALRARVTAYWDARLRASDETYDFYPPHQEGDATPFEGHALQYTSFKIEKVAIEGDRAIAVIVPKLNPYGSISGLLARSLQRAGQDFTVSEEWLRRDGVWYRKPIPPGLSKFRGPRNEDAANGEPASSEEPTTPDASAGEGESEAPASAP